MPTNLYGPNDNFDLETSHVLPAMLRKFHEAKQNNSPYVELWGTGSPMREFMHVDDMAAACVYVMQHYNEKLFLNIGVGEDISIKNLALLIKTIVQYNGNIRWDTTKPDGTPRKLLDVSRLEATGFKAEIGLRDGITAVYNSVFKQKGL